MATKPVVFKGNELIEATYFLSVIEQRLVLLAIVAARETGLGLSAETRVEIHASEYMERFNVEKQTAFQALKEACDHLYYREIVFRDIDPKTQKTRYNKGRWTDLASYVPDAAKVQIRFSREIIPLITRLSKNYTTYELEQVANLTSSYAIRLYELLIKWKAVMKTPVVSVETFRLQLGLEPTQYRVMSDFKKRVLDAAVSQVNEHTDIRATYEQIKEGRSIVGLRFDFTYKSEAILEDNTKELQSIVPTDKQISMFAGKLSRDHDFGSKYARGGESFTELEARLGTELKNEAYVKKYLPHLIKAGYVIKKSN